MNADEAIANLYELSSAAYQRAQPNLGNDLGRIADVIRAHVDRKVDDAMVERANVAYDACWANTERHDVSMKAALIAALGVE